MKLNTPKIKNISGKVIQKQLGLNAAQTKPTDELLMALGTNGKAMTYRRYLKIVRGEVLLMQHEAVAIAKWLSCEPEKLIEIKAGK